MFPPLALLLAACAPEPAGELEVELDEDLPSVVQLSFRAEGEGSLQGWVDYGVEGSLDHRTAEIEGNGGELAFSLLGLPFLADVDYRLHVVQDGEERVIEGSTRTGGLPAELPDLQATTHDEDALSPEPYFLAVENSPTSAVLAVDRQGRWLWYEELEPGRVGVNAAFDPSDDGDLYYASFSVDKLGDEGCFYLSSLDPSRHRGELVLDAPNSHHIFTVLPDGRLAWLEHDVRELELGGAPVPVGGDAVVVQLEPGSQESAVLFSTWDAFEPEVGEHWQDELWNGVVDWTHGDALSYDEQRDSFLVTFMQLEAVAEIDAQDGELLSVYGGGELSDYAYAEGTPPISHPHSGNWSPEGHLLVFNTYAEAGYSEAVEYEVDEEAGLLRAVWTHGSDGSHYSFAQGTVRPLSNGNRLVGFSTEALLQEVTPDDRVVWELEARVGTVFGYALPFWDFYAPLTPP